MLTAGATLGAYEIQSVLGAGGMGEVYRARDAKLNRDVALKILPDAFASDPNRLARFTREAQTLAALSHPNIAHIYGLDRQEGRDRQDGRALSFIVMELVEGEDLSQKLEGLRAKGTGLPLDEALAIAKQIAEALEAAHEQGIIHRDLKPANIKVRADGIVKVLDFGLAKAEEPVGSGANVSHSPTITTPAMMTGVGVILGTAAYMAPEQARGKALDKRADIWAFGCVLYEMLACTRAFVGDDVSEVLASVLKTDPNWQALPVDTPAALQRLLRRCLEKDPRRRLQAIGEARVQIDDLLSGAPDVAGTPALSRALPRWQRALPWGVAGTALAGAMLMLVLWAPWRPAAPPGVTRLTIATTGTAALRINGPDRDLAITPDGTRVVYVGNNGTQLFVRTLDALEPVAIATGSRSSGLAMPFVSPDGRWVGFIETATTLRKVAITGGPPVTLANLDGPSRGATWAPDDTIIFATVNTTTGLHRVSAAGGTPEVLTRPDHAKGEADHLWPEILPGGRAVLFTITSQTGGLDAAQVAVRDLRTGTHKVLLSGGSHGHYVASGLASTRPGEGGHLVYVAAGSLRAIPFDPDRLETHGTAALLLPQLATTDTGTADFATSTDGTLVYVDGRGTFAANARTLVWVDRSGKEEPISAPPRAYVHARLSPDGARVALATSDLENDIWIWDLRRPPLTRLTLGPDREWFPVWTPDGRRIIFSSNRLGEMNLWWQAADGTDPAERLTASSHGNWATGITPDGTAVIFMEQTPAMGRDLMQLALDGVRPTSPGRGEPVEPRLVTRLLQTQFDERNGIVSPDGRWLAFESNSAGAFEIYVRPYPNVAGGQWIVSTAGGTRPLWSRSGKELFYVGPDGALMRVPVEASGSTWNAGTPMKLLEGRYFTSGEGTGRTYDVSPDGLRFLMIKAPVTDPSVAPAALIVVQHWDEELKRLVPTK